jgi:hypothetical protein
MDLPDLKELKAILKLCRAQGVTDITLGSVAIKFGDMPYEIKGGDRVPVEEEQLGLTDEEMAMWSAAPDPLVARLGDQQ